MSKWGIREIIDLIGRTNAELRPGGNLLYRGKWLREPTDLEQRLQTGRHNGWVFMESWSDEPYVYNWVWDGDSRGAFLTFCENDLTLSLHPAHTPEYGHEYRRAELFYRRPHYEARGIDVDAHLAALVNSEDPIGELPRDDAARGDMGGDGDPHNPENYRCARCKRPGALYDGNYTRPEGNVCWVCVDAEQDPEDRDDNEYWSEMKARDAQDGPPTTCGYCHTEMPANFVCDGALGTDCPNFPLEDA
jgi:hypothetical protein